MEHTIYLDLETIPSGPPIDPSTLEPPGNISKQETIDKWKQEKAPVIAESLYRKRALKSMEGEIFCICWAVDDSEVEWIWDYHEEDLLFRFECCLEEKIDLREAVTWVGHNALTFDMAWIWRRSIKYDMKMLSNMIRLDKYKGNVQDTMLMWRGADYQDYTSLDSLARWLGLGEQVGSGADVYDQYLAGEYDKIIDHCKADVSTVRAVYKKIKGLTIT